MDRKRRWVITLACLLPAVALVIVLSLISPVAAEVSEAALPHIFYGAVNETDGEPASIGTEILAVAANPEDAGKVFQNVAGTVNPLTTEEVGLYGGAGVFDEKLEVSGETGDMYLGMPIAFYIDGARADVRECDTPGSPAAGATWQTTWPWTTNDETCLDLRPAGARPLEVTAGSCCTVSVSAETGNVTVAPGDTEQFMVSGDVVLEALTDTCCDFVEWTGDVLGAQNPITVTMDADKTVVAVCTERGPFDLMMNVVGNGSVDLDPEQPVDGYACGTEVSATAVASDCWQFMGWSGDLTGTALSETVQMDAAKEITATFALKTYDLTVVADPAEGGTVTGGGVYECGETITVTAVPTDDCWIFTGWLGDVDDAGVPTTAVHIDGNKTVTATFERLSYDLTVVADPPEGGTVTGSGTYSCCETITVTAVPTDDCWIFTGWLGDVKDAGVPNTTVHIDGNKTVTATFEERGPFALKVNVVGGGSVDLDPQQPMDGYVCGTVVSVTAVFSDPWAFMGWSGALDGSDNPETITMDAAKEITATFAAGLGTLVGEVPTDFHGPEGFTVTVKLIQGGGPVFTDTLTLDANGMFTLTNIAAGIYDVWVKNVHTLAQREDNVEIAGGLAAEASFDTLWEGDANDNNVIDSTDFSLWRLIYLSGVYDPRADFNVDGVVNTTDFSIWRFNFLAGRIGDPDT